MSTPTNIHEDGKITKKKRKAKSPLVVDSNTRVSLSGTDFTTRSVYTSTFSPFGSIQHSGVMSTGLNFGQSPFGHQFVSSPPFTPFTPISSVPPWATELLEDVKKMRKSVDVTVEKIGSIEKTVNRISAKVDDLDTKVKSIDTRLIEVEKASTFHSETFEETKNTVENAKAEIKKLNEKCVEMERAINTNRETAENNTERSLRENLLFFGIQERPGENCEELVADLIKTKLEIDNRIEFDRVHRIGQPFPGKVRPIVAKFHKYKERELVRNTAFEKSQTLKADNLGVGVQQSRATIKKRRDMVGIVEREKAAGRQVKWSGAKLLVRDGPGGVFRQITS